MHHSLQFYILCIITTTCKEFKYSPVQHATSIQKLSSNKS